MAGRCRGLVRVVVAAAVVATLASGCERATTPPPTAAPAAPSTERAPAPPLFVGAWAARPALCAGGAWAFSDSGLETAGEVSCRWSEIAPRRNGWILTGVCTAEGPPEPHRLTMAFDPGDPNAATVSGGPFAGPQRLVRCGAERAAESVSAAAEAIDARIAAPGSRVRAAPFRYELERMEAWREDGAIVRIVEPARTDAGAIRGETVWYFRPGETEPFLVRRPFATFHLSEGRLVGWFDETGRPTSARERDRASRAQDLLERARALRRAAGG